jgi:hypothetical protein
VSKDTANDRLRAKHQAVYSSSELTRTADSHRRGSRYAQFEQRTTRFLAISFQPNLSPHGP